MGNDDSVLSIYLREIQTIPLMSREEENELAVKAKAGDKAAKDKIVSANLRFVVNVAKNYQGGGLDLSDLISEGNIGLLTAIEKFDSTKGYHFISYAVWWIRQSILKAICEKSRAIRLPLNRANDLVQIVHARKLVGTTDKTENQEIAEIAEMLHMDETYVREMLNINREMVSLDAQIFGEDGISMSVGDFIEDERYAGPDETVMDKEMRREIDETLNSLRPDEARVLRMRFGLGGGDPMSLKEIGDKCHLTKERIRQIEKRAIVRMQHPVRVNKLESYVA
ncbi:MAG: RNA polymerase sigma factor RpoD/SigA [Treponemataceae bacterium]|nr:RNA polymerase sigma factor RpoD/SigA [Treponemataceae bacterium]